MNLSSWTDAQLIATREKLLAWYLASQYGRWKGVLMFITLFAACAGVYGLGLILEHGIDIENGIYLFVGIIAVYAMHRHDKRFKTNQDFLAELNSELSRRGHQL
jgi:hypothetical protein